MNKSIPPGCGTWANTKPFLYDFFRVPVEMYFGVPRLARVLVRGVSRVPNFKDYMEFMEYTVFMVFKKFMETQSRKF